MNVAELLRALDLALEGNWDEAHRTVQAHEDSFACWIHAALHRQEGDEGNSRYWYRRAAKEYPAALTFRRELETIREALNLR